MSNFSKVVCFLSLSAAVFFGYIAEREPHILDKIINFLK